MKRVAVPKQHVLSERSSAEPDLPYRQLVEFRRLAKFWTGVPTSKWPREQCEREIRSAMGSPARLKEIVESLPAEQKEVLSVCKRYGGALCGPLLRVEVLARGLVIRKEERRFYDRDLVNALCDRRILIPLSGGYSDYAYRRYGTTYPDVAAIPGLLKFVEPAEPMAWELPVADPPDPGTTFSRSPSEAISGLVRTAQALSQLGRFKVNQAGDLSKLSLKKLQKLAPAPDGDRLLPPGPHLLHYELLKELGAVEVDELGGSLDYAKLEKFLESEPITQLWQLVRAWLDVFLWQDGLGPAQPTGKGYDHQRINPSDLFASRRLVVWALGLVAHSEDVWLDLHRFLRDLFHTTGESLDFYSRRYVWSPDLPSMGDHRNLTGIERELAHWMENEAVWVSNVILSTLAHFGLVERGIYREDRKSRHCFRLTPFGRIVFGAPEVEAPDVPDAGDVGQPFLMVQPTHEVLAFLDAVEASQVWKLAKFADRAPSAEGPAQTFKLTRESVYRGLESGLTAEEITEFLRSNSRAQLPDLVERSLAEWSQKRESLVVRTGVSLCALSVEARAQLAARPNVVPIGDHFALIAKTAKVGESSELGDLTAIDHQNVSRQSWRIGEDGRVEFEQDRTDSLGRARLHRFASYTDGCWKITSQSVARAREHGLRLDQIDRWLAEHQVSDPPGIFKCALRNWMTSDRKKGYEVRTDDVFIVQVASYADFNAISKSRTLGPMLHGAIGPEWVLVRKEKKREFLKAVEAFGFRARDECEFRGS